jgi:hypothetical protein
MALAAPFGASAPSAAAVPGALSVQGGFTASSVSRVGAHAGLEHRLVEAGAFRSVAGALLYVLHRGDTQDAFGLAVRWGQRYAARFGLSFESHVGLGLQATRYDTTSFDFTTPVAVERRSQSTRLGVAPHVLLGVGFDLEPLLHLPLQVYVRPGVTVLLPDLNLAFQTATFAELGVRWTPRR